MARALTRRAGLLALPGLAGGVLAGSSPLGAAHAWAPSRPLRLVVPSVPASTPDVFCRLLAEEMRGRLSHGLVVENRPGGAGTIGLLEVARAVPDGHTLGYANVITLAINHALLPSQPYVAERDFRPVALIGLTQNILVARPGLPVRDIETLVALLRRLPGRVTYGSAGSGTTGHLAGELFCRRTGTTMVHVPYRGGPQALAALLSGEVDLAFDAVGAVEDLVRRGDARPLAVTGAHRAALLAEVPTMQEAGLAGFDISFWGGLVVPAAVPDPAIGWLNDEVNAALAAPLLRARYAARALEPLGGPPALLFQRAARERPLWAELVQATGAKMD